MEKHEVDRKLDLVAPRLRVHSPMLEALAKENVRHVQLMLKVGSDPNQTDAMRRTPLIILSYYRDERKAARLANYIIALGGKIDYADINGMNALHHACHKSKAGFAATLLRYRDDYDVFATDKRGKMCFDYLHGEQNHNLLRKLKSIAVEYGLDPSVFQIKVPFRQSYVQESRLQIPQTHEIKHMRDRKLSLRQCFCHKTDETINEVIPYEMHQVDNETRVCEQAKVGRIKIQRETQLKHGKHHFQNRSGSERQSMIDVWTKKTQELTKGIKKYSLNSDRGKDHLAYCSNELDDKYRHSHREQAEEGLRLEKSTIDNAGCRQEYKRAKSSKENLIGMLKIYEMQNSVLYREGAKERPIEEKFDNTSTTPSPHNVSEEEIQLATSGRTSRSMSLLLGSIPSMIKKRRPSRVSLQSNKPLKSKSSDPSSGLNITRQRRFSNITSSKFSQQSISPEGIMRLNTSSLLSLSASNISLIKKTNADRKNNNVDILMTNYATHSERKVNFNLTEVPKLKSRNIQKKVSSLPALNAFMEMREQSENAEHY